MIHCLHQWLISAGVLHVLDDTGNTLQWIVGVGTAAFLVQYTAYARWWKNFIGRSIVLLDISILGILGPSLAALANPASTMGFFTGPWYAYLETGVLGIACYTAISRIYGFWRLHKLRKLNGSAR